MFILPHDIIIVSDRIKGVYYEGPFLSIKDNIILLRAKYGKNVFLWDGCTGARDGKRGDNGLPLSWIASAIHDALWRDPDVPMTGKQKDLIFYDELVKINFKFRIGWMHLEFPAAKMYYLGVRLFGPDGLIKCSRVLDKNSYDMNSYQKK